MPPVFQINITGGTSSSSSPSSQSGQGRIPYAIDPRTEQSWTPRHELVMQQREERKREMAAEKSASYQAQQIKKGADKIGSLGMQSGRAAGAMLGQVGGPGAAIAGGELGGLLGGQVGGALAGALGAAAAPVAAVLAPLAAVVGAAYVAFKAFTASIDYFVERGAALAPYSGQISVARAGANVRSQLGDIREAGALGGGISRLTDAQSRLEDTFRQLMEPIKKFVVEVLADIMETAADFMGDIGPILKEMIKLSLKILPVIFEITNPLLMLIYRLIKAIHKWPGWLGGDGGSDEDKTRDQINMLYSSLMGGIGDLDKAIDHQKVQATQQANTPVFGGL